MTPALRYSGEQIVIALSIAEVLHADQRDKGGNPYIHHLISVANRAGDIASPLEVQWVVPAALLHDSLEDTDATPQWLRTIGVCTDVIAVVEQLTHREDEPRTEYIRRVGGSRLASIIKLADLEDNMRLDRLGREPNELDLKRNERYAVERTYICNLWGFACSSNCSSATSP